MSCFVRMLHTGCFALLIILRMCLVIQRMARLDAAYGGANSTDELTTRQPQNVHLPPTGD
ncbi:hypothetical protein ACFODZ_00865 [Marinicella sediminis]|uniref:Uncharacterized protein n=1 Tax=Marinicella sediminis TaxID=1792834 RepID=A0ABV7J7Z5_9GAMM|nr:hypothetical protein [Marinicella sediminis]